MPSMSDQFCIGCGKKHPGPDDFCTDCQLDKLPKKFWRSDNWVLWFLIGLPILLLVVIAIGSTEETDETTTTSRTLAADREKAPTPRPRATSTPRPTPTPTPTVVCDSGDEQSYLVSVGEQFEVIVPATIGLSGQFEELSRKPAVMFDEDWRTLVILNVALLNLASQGILDLDAPSSLRDAESLIRAAAREMISATELYVEGLDELDVDKAEKGNERTLRATSYIEDFSQTVKRICGID